MIADFTEMALGIYGRDFAMAAGAVAALYAFLTVIDAMRRVFRYRRD